MSGTKKNANFETIGEQEIDTLSGLPNRGTLLQEGQ